jgi:hypothetical protein
MRQVGGFFPVSSTNKIDHHDIAEILLKVALSIINQIKKKTLLILKITHLQDKTHFFRL